MELPRKPSPYILKKRNVLFERHNKSFVVDHLDMNGMDIEYAYFKKAGGVCILPMNDKGEVCLVGQYRYALSGYSWELPAGGQEIDEEIYDTAVRELREEAGLEADEWIYLGYMHPNASNATMVSHAYLARGLKDVGVNPDEDEDLELMWLPWEDVLKSALEGEITEGLSLFTLFKAQAHLQSEESQFQ